MSVVVLHAYSRHNSGDGLLVDLTLQLLQAASVPLTGITLVASDAASFSELPVTVVSSNLTTRNPVKFGQALHSWRFGSLYRLVRNADLCVAVGGGYLRAGSAREGGKTVLAHAPQMAVATSRSGPTLYLPQSVGPSPRPLLSRLSQAVSRMNGVLHVRDDRSFADLDRNPNVCRTPDLAVLELGRCFSADAVRRPRRHGRWALVARDLPNATERYLQDLKRLLAAVPRGVLAVQSTGRGNADDAWYRTHFPGREFARLHDVLPTLDSVVSVRLHGALQSMLAGVPAIHLSYERKGFGAFADLGLSPFVHQARRFDTSDVAAQLKALMDDPSSYWAAVSTAAPGLSRTYAALVEQIRDASPLST